ncbi:MAG: ABC transporter ATP-binding protein [Mariprofundaceae bacterium]
MIEARGLTRYFHGHAVVWDMSFSVQRGEVLGLLGPNGAGKSTTMRMLTGFLPPSSGAAVVAGVSLDGDTIELRRRIGYLPENAPSYHELDVATHLRFIGRMHDMSAGAIARRTEEMVELCGLEQVLHRPIGELSKGFKQRVGLAACMLHDPDCLIMDEPASGLDPNQIIEMRALIRRLAEDKAVLLSSHILSEVEASCDRVLIMDDGRQLATGTVEELALQLEDVRIVRVSIRGGDQRAVMARLRERWPEAEIGMEVGEGEARFVIRLGKGGAGLDEAVFQAVVEAGAVMTDLRHERESLEDVFKRLTGGGRA